MKLKLALPCHEPNTSNWYLKACWKKYGTLHGRTNRRTNKIRPFSKGEWKHETWQKDEKGTSSVSVMVTRCYMYAMFHGVMCVWQIIWNRRKPKGLEDFIESVSNCTVSSLWCHQQACSTSQPLCEGNPPVTGGTLIFFSLLSVCANCRTNTRLTGNSRRHDAHLTSP